MRRLAVAPIAVVAALSLIGNQASANDDDPNPDVFHQRTELTQANATEWNNLSPCYVDFWALKQIRGPMPPGYYHYNWVQWGAWTSCTSQYGYTQECIARLQYWKDLTNDGIYNPQWHHWDWAEYHGSWNGQYVPAGNWTSCMSLQEEMLPDWLTYRVDYCFGLYTYNPAANWWWDCYKSVGFSFPT